jgi:hypothetical protein
LPRRVTWQPTTWFLQLEVRDGLAGPGEHGLLAGDQGQVALDVGDLVLVGLGVDAGVEDDLHQPRHLVLVLVAAALHQRGDDLLVVELLECGNGAHGRWWRR